MIKGLLFFFAESAEIFRTIAKCVCARARELRVYIAFEIKVDNNGTYAYSSVMVDMFYCSRPIDKNWTDHGAKFGFKITNISTLFYNRVHQLPVVLPNNKIVVTRLDEASLS